MARVLVCADGFFRAFSPFGLEPYIESFIEVLARHGNQVMPYICRDFEHKKTWKRKIYSYQATQEVKKFDPEIVLAFNNAFDPTLFSQFKCPVFVVASDTPIYWSNKDLLRKKNGQYSVLYFNNDMADTLRSEYNIPYTRQLLIPYSTDVHGNKSIKFTKDITFIGNFYNPNSFLFDFFFADLAAQSDENKEKLRKLIIQLIDELQISHQKRDKTLEIYKQIIALLKKDEDYDRVISEIFGALTSEKRIELLSGLSDMDLHIYTWDQNVRCISNLYSLFKKCHLNAVYSIKANEQIYNESKISLSLPHAQVNTGFSWRVCDIMASNSMLLSNPTDDLVRLFGGIVPTFNDAKELKDKCQYFFKHEKERIDIVNTCQKLIDKNHRYENVFEIIENYSRIKLLNIGQSEPICQFSRTNKKQQRYLKRMEK